MNRISIICFFLACFCFASCSSKSGNAPILPLAIGGTGDLLVVMPEYHWKGVCGDSIRQYLTEPVWGLPGLEPMLNLTHQNSLSKFMQKFRNIMIIDIEPTLERGDLKIRNNVYADNQAIFNVDAPSTDSVISIVFKNKNLITTYVLMKGREALIADYKKNVEASIVERMKDKFGIDILVPKPYTLDVDKDNFVWIAREQNERNWGILIWEEPYVSTSQLDADSLIIRMNAVTKKHVFGNDDGSAYMATESALPPAVTQRFKTDSVYFVQMNGLWQMENGFLGGPYVNHTIVDTKRGRLVTGVGFVFYPNRDKLQMVRQLEAILYTMTPAAITN